MAEWWETLNTVGKVLACIAIPSTLIMLIQVLMMLFGIGHDADADISVDDLDIDGDGIPDVSTEPGVPNDVGFQLISFRTIIAFLAVFGWTGLLLLGRQVNEFVSLGVAAVAGLIVMIALAAIFMWLMKLQSDGSMNIRNALGVSGTVYLRIPAERKGAGKVNLLVQGSYTELQAVTDEATQLEFGEEVIVIGISGQNTLIVKRK